MNTNHDGHDDYDDQLYGMGSQGKGISEWVLGAGFLLLAVLLFVIVMNLRAGEPKAADPGPQYAEFPPTTGRYWVMVTRIIDGDTAQVAFIVPSPHNVRIIGIDAPERNTPEGQTAKNYLADITPFRTPIMLTMHGQDSFRRILADYPSKTKPSVADDLVEAGHAKRFWKKEDAP